MKGNHCATEKKVTAITVGRLVRRKGVEWFVSNVMPALKDTNLKYYIVGSGDDQERIKAAIEKYHLHNQVQMLGKVSDAQLCEMW